MLITMTRDDYDQLHPDYKASPNQSPAMLTLNTRGATVIAPVAISDEITPAAYEVVTENGTRRYSSLEALAKDHRILRYHHSTVSREELQGQPVLKGLYGPMYGGRIGQRPVVRYETQRVYDILSR